MWNILIADDEGIEQLIVKKVLTDYYQDSCTVCTAMNGREAIEAARKYQIQIAIMDISMPGINGIDAAKSIKKELPECSIIFLTAYSDFSYAKEAITVNAIDYLLKPCLDEELINAVDAAMQTHRNLSLFHQLSPTQRQHFQMPCSQDNANVTDNSAVVAAKIIDYMKSNYHKDLSLQDMAEMMGYSEVYFCKLFKNIFDVNFTSYLTDLRISEAKELLEDPSVNIKDVAICVGYPDPNYFAKVFKRREKISPSEFRAKI